MTWNDAKTFAENQGGHLVVITSAEEQGVVEELIREGTKKQYWLGGFRGSGDQFQWVTDEAFIFSKWDDCEPNNFINNEKYIQIYRQPNPANFNSTAMFWNDAPDNNTLSGEEFFSINNVGFIVEYEKPHIPKNAVCVEESGIKHYYAILEVNHSYSWDDAEEYCESLGGHLATLSSRAQNEAAYKAVMQNYYTVCVYFGLSDESKEAAWTWVTGEQYLFANWGSGEPNGSTGENFGAFYIGVDAGCWVDADFKEQSNKPIICEWDVK